MSSATLTSKGQLTLPEDVRLTLGVRPGDRVDFILMEDGNFVVLAATRSVKSLNGIIRKPENPVSVEDLNDAIANGATNTDRE
jgi:AbrB family looped-hinge helix DNA binding protein